VGRLKSADGRVREGEFRNGEVKLTFPGGRIFQGKFKDDLLVQPLKNGE